MDIVNILLVWLHFLALAAGGAATFGIPVVASKLPTAGADTRPVLMAIIKAITTIARAALGTLIVTGLAIVWLKYGSFGGLSVWFWVKMAFVVALLAGVIYGGINMKRAAAGDAQAGKRGGLIGRFNALMLFGVVLSAVFAFP